MGVNLDLGDTRRIIAVAVAEGVLRNQLAYILATAFWETGRTMKPVEEAFYLDAKRQGLAEEYRRKLRYYPWHGRGYVQLTWERNYIKAGRRLGLNMTADKSVAMQPAVATRVLVIGMIEGWFTGKKLGDYITLKDSDFLGARRIINGVDERHAIAAIAKQYDAALKAEGYGVTAPVAAPRPQPRPLERVASLFRRPRATRPATPAPAVPRAPKRSLPVHAFLGLVALWTRIGLFAVFGAIADHGVGVVDKTTGTFTVRIDDLNTFLVGLIGIGLTYASSRIAKRAGLAT